MTHEWTPERIKRLRTRLGLSQREFAPLVGVLSGDSIGGWENGRINPSLASQLLMRELEAQADIEDEAKRNGK